MANDIPISEREREILRLVATGASNQQIAQQLSISINTVKVHLRNIFSKIGVVSRTEATVYAINNGLVAVDRVAAAPIIPQANGEDRERAQAVNEPRDEPVAEDGKERAPVIVGEPWNQQEPAAPAPVAETPHRPAPAQRPRVLLVIGAAMVLLILTVVGVQVAGRSAASNPTPAPAAVAPTADTIDPNQRWFTHPPMPNPRDDFAITAYDLERKLYLIGGTTDGVPSAAIDRFDPESNLWVSLTNKPTAVSDAGAIVLRGNIYVPGGVDAEGNVRDILEVFDPREQRWRRAAPLPAPRSHYALVAWEGQLYLFGGWDGSQVRDEVYVYDPQADRWGEGPALPSPRQEAGATILSGQIYVIGGKNANGALRESLQFNPAESEARWKIIAPLPYALTSPGVVATINTIFVFDPDEQQGFEYNQTADAWVELEIPDSMTISSKVILLESSIYIIGEARSQSPGAMSEYKAIFTIYIPIPS